LSGITIVELATIIAAPLGVTMLADLGARVIKIEAIDGDPYRHLIAGGTVAAKTNAGKESICLNLKSEEGRRIARDLMRTADVAVFNTRPGVADRLGLGAAELRAENPNLIWVSVTGYARRSPAARRPATHPCAGAASGGAGFQAAGALAVDCPTLADVREISRQLMRANESNPDPNTSAVAASAVTLALLARERFGIAQEVYVNMLAANLYANADDAIAYEGKKPRPAADPELMGLDPGYRLYRAAAGWLFLALTSDEEWQRAWTVLERPDLARDERFGSAAARAANGSDLAVELAKVIAERSADEWEAAFVAARLAGVRADGRNPGPFFAHDEQMLANDFAPVCTHPRFGVHRRWGAIVRVNGGLPDYQPGVLAGQHTDALLAELGRDADEIARLRADRVVASEPVEWT
jgi:crotonobetainyl-CoA:carnitine CoA-transferase CaiB-like acyl-CoA transferase